jgi:hypothetical protein
MNPVSFTNSSCCQHLGGKFNPSVSFSGKMPGARRGKKIQLKRRGCKLAHASHFPPTPAGAGIGTWTLKIALQPVAVASTGQSLSHSA